MHYSIRFFSIIPFFFLCFHSYGQRYDIKIKIKDLDSANIYLGYYMKGNTYLRDTALYLGNENYLFQGDENLDKGMYFIVRDKNILFDFVINKNQKFQLQTEYGNYIASMQVTDDIDNQLFFENLYFNAKMRVEANPYVEVLKDSLSSDEEKNVAKFKTDSINTEVKKYQYGIIQEYPESILTTLFNSTKLPEIPDEFGSDNTFSNRLKKLLYFKDHYWDYFDLGNPFFLRLSNDLYTEKVDNYLDNLVYPKEDSIILEATQLIVIAKKK